MSDDAILKVYPAKFWHDNVIIIGNKQGLLKLKQVIDAALSDETGVAMVKETDGKQYTICSKMHDGDILDEKWLNLPAHYEEEGDISQEELEFLSKFLLEDRMETTQI